jgi:hypothetical protein
MIFSIHIANNVIKIQIAKHAAVQILQFVLHALETNLLTRFSKIVKIVMQTVKLVLEEVKIIAFCVQILISY